MPLVEIKKFELLTHSAAIAEGVKRRHESIIKLIDRHREDLEEFGRVGFEIRTLHTDGGPQKQRMALLNEQQTTLLITYMRNHEGVRAFKKRLVGEFFRMRYPLESKKKYGHTARLEYTMMTEAIQDER